MLEITIRPMIKNEMLSERHHETFDDAQIQHMLNFIEHLRSAKYADGTHVYNGVSIYTSRLEDKRETHEHFVLEF